MTVTASDRYLRVSAAARLLQTSEDTVRLLFDQGMVAGVRSDTGHRLLDIESLKAYRSVRYLSVSDAAQRLGVSRETVKKRFDAGILTGIRTPGGHRLIDPGSLPC